MTPNARFTDFITDINPSRTTTQRSQSAHHRIREGLQEDETYSRSLIKDFLGGSYKRQTAIRPVVKNGDTERPDVDIYVVVKGSTWETDPSELVENLYNALDRNRDALNINRLHRNRCSIAISTNTTDMDISPLLERSPNGYYIGNRETGEWYETDPEKHSEWSSEQNDNFSGRFKPSVKLIKWARRENPTKYKHPKSFALEVITAKHMNRSETHYGKIIHGIFDDFVKTYAYERSTGLCPHIEDPAVLDGNLLSGVSGEAFGAYYDKIKRHRDDADRALNEDDQDKATKYWRRIFGNRFPAPKSSASGLAATGVLTISPLAFPDKLARPSNRPSKFA